MNRPESLPETFVRVMARIAAIDADVSNDDPGRHEAWKLRQLAESCIANGMRQAADVCEVAYGMKLRRESSPAQGRSGE